MEDNNIVGSENSVWRKNYEFFFFFYVQKKLIHHFPLLQDKGNFLKYIYNFLTQINIIDIFCSIFIIKRVGIPGFF